MTAVNEYLAHLTLGEYSPTTVYKRRLILTRIPREISVADLFDATESDWATWYARLAKRVTPGSRAAELSTLRAYMRWALERGLISTDRSARLPMPRTGRRYPRPIAEDRLTLVIATAPDRVRPMLLLAAYAGFRACEIAGLRREDVMDAVSQPVLIVQRGKGNKQRVVPLHPLIAIELPALPRSGWVFPYDGDLTRPVPPHRVSHLCNIHLHSVGVPDTLHSLRHRFGTAIYQQTRDLRLTQDLLGHSNPNTTALYAAWHQPDAARAVAGLHETAV